MGHKVAELLEAIRAAELLGSELSPWGEWTRDALIDHDENESDEPATFRLLNDGHSAVCQLQADVATLDDAPDEIDEAYARLIASAWHGGQWSPLYAFQSTGTVLDGLTNEINLALYQARSEANDCEYGRLRELLRFLVDRI